ncbi:hypothetical protein J6590_027318 [Homalodisca vitripennis]|nr:hypothetical protein J6590_027318 [Homalodisca vitripennis]
MEPGNDSISHSRGAIAKIKARGALKPTAVKQSSLAQGLRLREEPDYSAVRICTMRVHTRRNIFQAKCSLKLVVWLHDNIPGQLTASGRRSFSKYLSK